MPPKAYYIDVLIVGAGPAGLMCAHALAAAGVNVKIIDKRALQVDVGHADGITPRTTEVLQSYGLAERLIREGRQIHMSTFYKPGQSGTIECTERTPVVNDPSARYPYFITLNQAAIEAIFIDSLKNHGLEIERPKQPSALEISQDVNELSSSPYPVKVTLVHLDAIDDESKTEIIHAKYVIGADGAHSWIRKTLGIEMEGEQTEYIWGVVDVVLETNFPDIRNFAVIQSENGSCLNVPREGDKNRLYIQLPDTDAIDPLTRKVDRNRISPEKLLSVGKNILLPYELVNLKEIEWWTIYIVGQRVAASYSAQNCVFIAGDACHTHSPKAGQGMNAAINDAHNLAWKLVQVLRGWSSSSLLKTYEDERRNFAQDLINMDKVISTLISEGTGAEVNADGLSPELSRAYQAHHSLMMGFSIQYSPSVIVDRTYQNCAENLVIGQRMPPQIFVRAADIHPIHIQDLLPADVRFKILFFVGNLTPNRIDELNSLAEELSNPSSFLCKYSADGRAETVFDIITIIAGKNGDVNFLTVPLLLRPHWSKVLLDDTDTTGKLGGGAYVRFGINPTQITLVAVRPDGYVGTVASSTTIGHLERYFGSFMVPRGSNNSL